MNARSVSATPRTDALVARQEEMNYRLEPAVKASPKTVVPIVVAHMDALVDHARMLEGEVQDLAAAIAGAAQKAGIYNGQVPLTGPHLMMLCDDLATACLAKDTAPNGRSFETPEQGSLT